jgi:hypothetical protein
MGYGQRRLGLVCAGLVTLAAACSAPVRTAPTAVFFPEPPAPPRIQYLTSLSGLKDIDEQSTFSRFVVGEKPDIKLDKPYGVAIHDGKIYVCDTNATVAVFDLKKKSFGMLKGATGAGTLKEPINISIEADGTKYVADPARSQVVVFDRNDDYLKAYGIAGAWRPVDAVPFDTKLYVADPKNGVIKVFDKESGNVVKTIGDKGDPAERLNRPTNLAFDHDGYLYVTDVGRFQVVKFDRDGHFKGTIGKLGDNLGHFARPKGLALDRNGRLYVVDASFNNVQIFNDQGRLLMYFGQGGERPGDFTLPAQVAIDYDNLQYFQPYVRPDFQMEYAILVISQFGPHRVSILAFGKEKGKDYPNDAELLKQMDLQRKQELGGAAPPAPTR